VFHAAQLGVIQKAIRRYRVKDVLEIAPGPGRLSCQVTGFERGCICDINREMLCVARDRLKKAQETGQRSPKDGIWQIIEGDAFKLPFIRVFDMVYTFRLIRHFELRERELIYRQIHSRLKPGGILVFDAVNEPVAAPLRMKEDQSNYPIYDVLYRKDALVEEITRQGFEVVSLTPLMRHISLQQKIQVYLGPRSYSAAKALIQFLEYMPGDPLEWIVECRKATA
jgi:SAM-dependent methyltransferase